MNLNKFQHLLSTAKNMVNDNSSQQEIQDFFVRNGINATKTMMKDFMQNIHKVREVNLEVNL